MKMSRLACFAIVITSYLLVLSPLSSQVKADQLLMSSTCNKSQEIAYCEACFNSNKESAINRDLRGLGGLAIRCGWNQVETMRGIWSECYYTKKGDEWARCKYCSRQFGSAEHYLLWATIAWRDSRYADCVAQLQNASDHVFDCRYMYRDVVRSDDEKKYLRQAGDTTGYIYAASGVIQQLL